jgi:DNA polymerase III subunit beta
MLENIEDESVAVSTTTQSVSSKFEISLKKRDFVRSLSHVQSVVERKNIIPILSHALISARKGQIELTATDMDIVISEKIPANIISEGEITVSAGMIYEIARKLDDDKEVLIKFDSTKSVASIYSGNCKFHLSTLSVKDFPKLDDLNYKCSFKIGVASFKLLLDQCKFAISADETRYNLNGIYMQHHDSCIRLVATDGHRLSVASSPVIEGLQEFTSVIIPKKTVLEIRKIIDEAEGDINISISDNKVKFYNNNFSLTSKLIDAKFPNYENLIPQNNDIVLEMSSKNFSVAVDRVSTITNEKFRGIELVVDGNVLAISSNSEIGGTAKEEIEIQNNHSSKLEVGFNARYVLEVMTVIKGEDVLLSFKDPFAPAIIKEKGNKNFQYIIMPMRV